MWESLLIEFCYSILIEFLKRTAKFRKESRRKKKQIKSRIVVLCMIAKAIIEQQESHA